jgi:hypothetical protein
MNQADHERNETGPLHFSEYPGRRERHLLRKLNNPLFPETKREINSGALEEAQRLDHEELVEFITGFRRLVHKAVGLKPNEQSDVILGIKEELDQAYEQAAGVADDQTETKDAIRKLVVMIMNAVRNGATDDPAALQELDQETQARAAHFELLEFPLVADLLHPASPIGDDELVPTLLSASEAEFQAAMTLFDEKQVQELERQARVLLDGLEGGAPPGASGRL